MAGTPWERNRLAATALPLLIAATAALAAWQLARAGDNRRDARVSARASSISLALQQRITAYTDVLYGVRGLFEASTRVTRREFHLHLHAVDVARRYPGVRVVGVAELIPTDDAASFARQVRLDAARSGLPYPRFAIRGALALERRLVIDYIEPQRGNEGAFGLDFFSEPNRRRASERALESGRPTATAPVTLVQDRGAHAPGFLIVLPIRHDARTGVAYAGFRVPELVQATLAETGPADLTIEDIGPAAGAPVNEPARRVRTYRATGPGGDASHARTQELEVLGRRWSLRYAPQPGVLSFAERAVPWLVLAGGALLAALAARLLSAATRTERRAIALATRMTADLREAQTELERSNQELERFAYVASHDLREPLRSVTGFIGLLERRHGDALDDDARSWIGYALGGAERMNELIGDLLAYSRAGRPPAEDGHARADLQLAWDAAVSALAAAIEESGATVRAGRLPVVAADQREMNQVMQNLLGNAIKYRGDRAPEVRAEAERRAGDWAISVSDNGIGIEPHHQERIFVLFQRLHTRDDYEGTGMGLSIVKKIVEARGGSIAVESTPGEGSRFTVVLPPAD